MSTPNTSGISVSDYLISRLQDKGIGHVFGIPGDYVLSFYNKLSQSPLKVINTCDEQGAGFAADAYARLRGLGVVCVTYGVGGLKLVNSTAQAYAEKSPVLIISGAPGETERKKNKMMHHKANHYEDQLKIFERITTASTYLNNVENAFAEIDRVLDAILQNKRPGYIEIPRDMVNAVPELPDAYLKKTSSLTGYADNSGLSRKESIDIPKEVVEEALDLINTSSSPVLMTGVEVERYRLAEKVLALAWKGNIPICSTYLGKSVIPEDESLYMGVYSGALSNDALREYVESSDCLILIGVYFTDLDMGAYTAHLDTDRMIYMTSQRLAIRNNHYSFSGLDLLDRLSNSDLIWHKEGETPYPARPHYLYEEPLNSKKITANRVFQMVNDFLDDSCILLADPGDTLFGSIEICRHSNFISPAYYASLGFAVPGSIGAQLACPELRPVVLTGDGSFQMTGMELAAAARYGLNPIVIVLNNQGFGTERPMLDGPFNDVALWRYSKLPEIIGEGEGIRVNTEAELQSALLAAREKPELCVIEVLLEKNDISMPLQRLTRILAKKV